MASVKTAVNESLKRSIVSVHSSASREGRISPWQSILADKPLRILCGFTAGLKSRPSNRESSVGSGYGGREWTMEVPLAPVAGGGDEIQC